ncbi:MAG TPA: hypothetical protein VM430_03075, partial [Microbacterium sp.]|nr:hypothetical protein [Microbacterium sp.]
SSPSNPAPEPRSTMGVAASLSPMNHAQAVATTSRHDGSSVMSNARAQTAAQFDQQPIEVAAIADACARAFDITDDPSWRDVVATTWAWFTGDNDASTAMFDPGSGAGFDGLERDGRNENRGAESTLAALSTYQQARRLGVLEVVASR